MNCWRFSFLWTTGFSWHVPHTVWGSMTDVPHHRKNEGKPCLHHKEKQKQQMSLLNEIDVENLPDTHRRYLPSILDTHATVEKEDVEDDEDFHDE
jgi:hypothetical protein